MTEEAPPQQPKVEKVSVVKLRCLKLLEYVLTFLLVVTGLHVLGFYVWCIFHPNATEPMAVRYAVYIAIGSFFYLFVYYKLVEERWGAQDVTPYEKSPKKP